jgi:hypothetical protein
MADDANKTAAINEMYRDLEADWGTEFDIEKFLYFAV